MSKSAPGPTRTADPLLRRQMLYPAELRARNRGETQRHQALCVSVVTLKIGARGFEPPTPCAQGRCATGLRYAPFLRTQIITTERKRHKILSG